MTTLGSPTRAETPQERPSRRRWDVTALTGAVFVLGVVGAFIAAGNTPDGDASAETVIAHYAANRTQGIIASIVLALAAIPTLAFAARLRERARLGPGADRTLPNFAFAAGVMTAAGFLGAAAIHLALSDYARDLDLSAAQALNALDSESFVVFTIGIATLVLASSLIAIRSPLLPAWFGWIGIPVVVVMFTPMAFFAACVGGAWIIVASFLLFANGDHAAGRTRDLVVSAGESDGGGRSAHTATVSS